MKTLTDYIYEYLHTPDGVYVSKPGEDWHFAHRLLPKSDGVGMPIFINTQTNQVYIGEINETHEKVLKKLSSQGELESKLGIENNKWQTYYNQYCDKDPLLAQGRIFDLSLNPKFKEYGDNIYVVYWCQMSEKIYNNVMNLSIQEYINKSKKSITKYFAVDNNCKVQPMEIKKDVSVKSRDEATEDEIEAAHKMHNDPEFRKKKREFTAKYRLDRDEQNQKKYNSEKNNKSHTEVEHNWRNRTYNGKPYDGDSLHDETKPLTE